MPNPTDIEIAVRVINEVAGSPDSGVIADLVKQIKSSGATIENRIVEAKEKR